MTVNFYGPTAWAALGVWTPTHSIAVAGGVLDPNSTADTFAKDAFNKVNLYITSVFSYKLGNLPGQFSPAFNWSNKPKTDLDSPFSRLALSQIPQAVGGLLGVTSLDGLAVNTKDESWFVIANVSQYFYLNEDPGAVAKKLKSGQPLNGIGAFARFGYAPEASNPITREASMGLFAHGVIPGRQYDSFGAGFYYNGMSDNLKNDISRLTAGTSTIGDEKGVEVFYDFALTPAVRVIPGYQHVWDPVVARAAVKERSADVFQVRVTVAF